MDSSEGREPLAIIQGIGNIISGLEKELEGKLKGEKFSAVVGPEDAYGPRTEDNIVQVPLANFQSEDEEELEVGMQIQVESNHGITVAEVLEIKGEDVTIDMNHPLAGQTLHFDVEVVDVRDANEQELEHGHAHGPGGHQH